MDQFYIGRDGLLHEAIEAVQSAAGVERVRSRPQPARFWYMLWSGSVVRSAVSLFAESGVCFGRCWFVEGSVHGARPPCWPSAEPPFGAVNGRDSQESEAVGVRLLLPPG